MHRISLNTDVQPMFFLPNRFHLTWENPGPIEIDISKLTETEKNWLRNAKQKKVLNIENLNPESTKEPIVTSSTETSKPRQMTSEEIKKQAEEQRLAKIEAAKKTLKAPLPALLKSIENTTDLSLLRILLDIELANKKRERVAKPIEARISKLMSSVKGIVGEPIEGGFANEKNLPEIEEIVEETITINIGSDTE